MKIENAAGGDNDVEHQLQQTLMNPGSTVILQSCYIAVNLCNQGKNLLKEGLGRFLG